MYNKSLTDSIYGIVGWNQPTETGYAILDANNVKSTSGLKIDKISSFAKIKYLKDVGMDDPAADALKFNAYLAELQKAAISEVLDDLFIDSDLIESKPLFSEQADQFVPENTPGYFVGFQIEFDEVSNIALSINKAWLYFSENGTVKLLLFNQYKQEPIDSKNINVIANELTSVDLGWLITQSGSFLGGKYYIGYLTAGAPKCNEATKCANELSGITIESGRVIKVDEKTINPVLFGGTGKDYGLNFDFTIRKDVSQSVINNQFAFSKAIALKCAIKSVEAYIASARSNRSVIVTDERYQRAYFELIGDEEKKVPGLISRYETEIERNRKSFTNYGDFLNIISTT